MGQLEIPRFTDILRRVGEPTLRLGVSALWSGRWAALPRRVDEAAVTPAAYCEDAASCEPTVRASTIWHHSSEAYIYAHAQPRFSHNYALRVLCMAVSKRI